MRVVEALMLEAVEQGHPFKRSNTQVLETVDNGFAV